MLSAAAAALALSLPAADNTTCCEPYRTGRRLLASDRQGSCLVTELDTTYVLKSRSARSLARAKAVPIDECKEVCVDAELATRPFSSGLTTLAPVISAVRALELRNIQLDEAALWKLAGMSQACSASHVTRRLRWLSMDNNGLRASDADALGGLLRPPSAIRFLKIRSNDIGDRGAAAIAMRMMQRVKGNEAVRGLELTDTDVGAQGLEAIFMSTISAASPNDAMPLRFNLTIASHTFERHALLDAFEAFERRTRSAGQWTGPTLPAQKARQTLWLGLPHNALGDAGVTRLSRHLLHLFGNLDRGVRPLSGLDLRANDIGDSGARLVASTALRISSLTLLDMRSNPVREDGFAALISLCAHPSLKRLRLPAPPHSISLAGSKRLISDHTWEDTHSQQLDSALAGLPSSPLRELYIPRWDLLGRRAIMALLHALLAGSRLEELDLRGAKMDTAAANVLADALQKPGCQLRLLNLDEIGLSVNAVVRIARSLRNNTRMHTLMLSKNNVGVSGARALIESAQSAGALQHVSLVDSGVGNRLQSQLQRILVQNAKKVKRNGA